ncbi:aldehyde oxidase GLOX-like [Macadamia integrifolia]|uniref:aldehyde oxidase GLOX-like n=1 Tax=Macadamia integrifolia TaxID=60698 RepID=UPI001C4E8699|nr:aldehyde oxidase GLOX-like [Macadamia integrifolia]
MTIASILCFYFFFLFFIVLSYSQTQAAPAGGRWELLQRSIGLSAMHMQLLNNDRVVIYDRTDFGLSNLSLPIGKCREDPADTFLKHDCTAHSAEYDVRTNSIRPLMVKTDVWCSSGAVLPDGRLLQTGGFNDGERAIRTFWPCSDCDWEEIPLGLIVRRWYATNHVLPDGRVIVIGGRRQFNYEFYPKSKSTNRVFPLPFLAQTNDPHEENNLYPFVHLNVDGNLFIFSNNRAILLDYTKNLVVKNFPAIPDGGHPRCYPSTGSSVLLPLTNLQKPEAEVLICGGAPRGSYRDVNTSRIFIEALSTCGRIRITDPNPTWFMETMPLPRVMGDMTLLPTGDVLIINGAARGSAGWENGKDPVLNPVLYRPGNLPGSRFEKQNPSSIPRLYHSSAILLRDGRVLVGGSNPHMFYNFTGVSFPTDLSLEAFSPAYLAPEYSKFRPRIISPVSQTKISYGQKLVVRFSVSGPVNLKWVSVTMVAPSFTTHSFSMNQRLLVLSGRNVTPLPLPPPIPPAAELVYDVAVTIPNSTFLAPSGYYLLFVVHREIPSEGIWVQILWK